VELDGVGKPAQGSVVVGQVVHAPERVRVVRTQLAPAPGERRPVKLERVGTPAEFLVTDIGPVEPAVQSRIAEAQAHLAPDHRLIALNQLARRVIVSGANSTDEVRERGARRHL
jgi:hypothetical protein